MTPTDDTAPPPADEGAPTGAFPVRAAELRLGHLQALVATVDTDATVDACTVTAEKVYDPDRNEVSTGGRIEVELVVGGSDRLAGTHPVVVKVTAPEIGATPLYRNEVAVYTRLLPELGLETPRCFGGRFDEATGTFGLVLEDLTARGATFPNVKTPISVEHVARLLDLLAELHAAHWDSPRLSTDLAFVAPHTSGELATLFNHPALVPALIREQVETVQFKRELLESTGRTVDDLYDEVRKVQHHQAGLARTICHGDTHVGNTYVLPDGTPGLVDWQLAAQGHGMHDVTYLIVTALSVAQRRAHERELIAHYLDRLATAGVHAPPTFDEAWLEHRRAAVWGLYIGWLTTPIANYGWDITVCNHIRLVTAYRDLDTAAAIADLPDPPARS